MVDPAPGWTCTYDELAHAIACTRDGGPVGDLGTIIIEVIANEPGLIQNVCVSSGGSLAPDDDECSEDTTVNAAEVVPIPVLSFPALLILIVLIASIGMTVRTRQ